MQRHTFDPCPADRAYAVMYGGGGKPSSPEGRRPMSDADADAGWDLGDAYPRARRVFVTEGPDAPIFGVEFGPGSVHTLPALVAFRERLSSRGKAEFDRTWNLMYHIEAAGIETVLMLEQVGESTLCELAAAMEREAVRQEFLARVGLEDGPYDEFGSWPLHRPVDLHAEAAYLAEVIESATGMLAMIAAHAPGSEHIGTDTRFTALRDMGRAANADDVHKAAGRQLPWPRTEPRA